jgi:hypothetical protein
MPELTEQKLDLGNAAVRRFIDVAKQYCTLLEAKEPLSQRELVRQVHLLLLSLYSSAVDLPDVEPEPDAPEHDIDDQDRQTFYRDVIKKLGGELPYQKVFEPFNPEDWEVVVGTLADDLSGIYFDIKRGLLNLEVRSGVSLATVWRWRFNFEVHWGRHAASAIHAIHSFLYRVDAQE